MLRVWQEVYMTGKQHRRPGGIPFLTGLCIVTLLDMALIIGAFFSYAPLRSEPGAWGYLWYALLPLPAYAGALFWLRRASSAAAVGAVPIVAQLGGIGALLEIISIAVETFVPLPSGLMGVFSLGSMLALFSLWGYAGFRATRAAGLIGSGLLAAVGTAMVGVLTAVAFGMALGLTARPRLATWLAGSAEYTRSGWTDLRAFAVANQLDSASSHLVLAPIVAALCGSLGLGLARLLSARQVAISASKSAIEVR
jgi:hypothetical protein